MSMMANLNINKSLNRDNKSFDINGLNILLKISHEIERDTLLKKSSINEINTDHDDHTNHWKVGKY